MWYFYFFFKKIDKKANLFFICPYITVHMEKILERFKIWKTHINGSSKEEVYDYIWNTYHKKLAYYIKRTFGVSENTEDIVQDIMMKVYKSLEKYSPAYSFNTWIYSITRNYCIDHFRKKKLDTSEYDEENCRGTSNTPESGVLKKEMKKIITEALETLKNDEREIAFLHFYEQMKYKEISTVTGQPVGTIKYKMSLIKQKLEKVLEEYVL